MSYNPGAFVHSPVGSTAPSAPSAPSAPPADPSTIPYLYPSISPPTAQQQPPAPLRMSLNQGNAMGMSMSGSPYTTASPLYPPQSVSPSAAAYARNSFTGASSYNNNHSPVTAYAPIPPPPTSHPTNAAAYATGPGLQMGLHTQPSMHGGFAPVTPLTGPRMPLPGGGIGGVTNGVSSTPSSVVALRFRCKNLKTADVFSESDPFIVVYLEECARQWREIGRTETVVNSANPSFTTAVEIDYFFEEVQRLRLEVFDRDSTSEKLNAHDFLGCVELTMAQLMATHGQSMVLALLQDATKHVHGVKGHVVIDGEELSSCADQVKVQFAADKVDNKDGWFGKSDPFLNIYRLRDETADPAQAASWLHVWRSIHINDNLNPRWPTVTLSVRTLCNGQLQKRLKFECMDWEASGRHQFIGACVMTAGEFIAGEKTSVNLINPQRQMKKGKRYVNSGVLRILSLECFKVSTFAEYLRGGCEISLMVGIDFTASNGAFSDPSSLHYTGSSQQPGGYYNSNVPPQMNDYQSAITATGAILEPYDHDKRFPVYGFGAMLNGAVSHCFPLTFDPSQPEVDGVHGILRAYTDSFPYISLHGPTYFAPLIRQAATIASVFSQPPTMNGRESLKYFVLLIITDGAIMDMDNTIEEIVAASYLPLSIVIVGVGNADFSAMDALDADGKLLRSRSGRSAVRDIVQFVPFNKFRSNPARLAKETLAEIPMQLTQHFRARNIKPNPPLQRAGTDMLIANATVATNNQPAPMVGGVESPGVAYAKVEVTTPPAKMTTMRPPVSTAMVEILTPSAAIATMIPSLPASQQVRRPDRKSSSSSDDDPRKSSLFDVPSVRQRQTIPGVAQKGIVTGSEEATLTPEQADSATRANGVALLLVLSYLAVAILYYHFVEGWRVVDCVYFAMVIVTTVGYGDVVPVTTAGKAFTIFFAFYGICTIGMALGRLASWFLSRQQTIAKETTQRLLHNVDSAADNVTAKHHDPVDDKAVAIKGTKTKKPKPGFKRPKWLQWLLSDSNQAIATALVPICVSIGGGLVLGAIEGWPVLDCFYYAVITVTTVGFGDLSPKSEAGRVYAIFYLPLSVVSVAHGIGSVIEELGKRKVLKNKISMKELLAMDSDGDGKVSQLEYLSYMLVKLGKAEPSDIAGILAQFRKLDKDGSGELDKDDLERLDRHLQRQHED